MNILLIHQYYCPEGGIGNDRTRQFAEYFASMGHTVTVLTTTARFQVSESSGELDIQKGNVRIMACPVPDTHNRNYTDRIRLFFSFYRFALRKSSSISKPDIVYACSTPLTAAEAGRIIARRFKVPFVFEIQDVWPDAAYGMGIIRNLVLKWILDRLTRRLYRDADRLIALSEDMVPLVERLGDFGSKTVVIPNGTDIDLFQPGQEKKEGPFRFIYAGAMGRANGLEQLIEAVRILALNGTPAFRILMVGGGNRYSALRRQATGLEDWFEWIPEMPKAQVAVLMQQADAGIVCFAPVRELESNSANKFFDYLACGLPVVLNYGGWQARLLRTEHCGYSVQAGNPQLFAEMLLTVSQNQQYCKEMGENARKLAVSRFDRRLLATQVQELLNQCVTP